MVVSHAEVVRRGAVLDPLEPAVTIREHLERSQGEEEDLIADFGWQSAKQRRAQLLVWDP